MLHLLVFILNPGDIQDGLGLLQPRLRVHPGGREVIGGGRSFLDLGQVATRQLIFIWLLFTVRGYGVNARHTNAAYLQFRRALYALKSEALEALVLVARAK